MNPTLTGGASPGQCPLLPPKATQTPPQSLSFAAQGGVFCPPVYPNTPKTLPGRISARLADKTGPQFACAELSPGLATCKHLGNYWRLSGSEASHNVGEEGTILLLWRTAGRLRRLRRGRWALRQVAMDLTRVKCPTWLDLLAVFRDHISAAPFTVHTARHRVAGRVQHEPGCCEVAQIIAAYFRSQDNEGVRFSIHRDLPYMLCFCSSLQAP